MTPLPDWHDLARDAFAAGFAAGHPRDVTMAAMAGLADPPSCVIAIGKAGAAMAQAVRDVGCNAPGIVVTHDEGFAAIDGMRCFASAHPVPDERGLDAGAAIAELAAGLGVDDHLLLLISGGDSALVPAPAEGITLADKQALNAALLASGMDIHAMNAVRRLFSRLKGGRLARLAAPARITQFLLSDVPGDRLESIASGPAVADPVDLDRVLALIADNRLDQLDFVKKMMARIHTGTADLPVFRSSGVAWLKPCPYISQNSHQVVKKCEHGPDPSRQKRPSGPLRSTVADRAPSRRADCRRLRQQLDR